MIHELTEKCREENHLCDTCVNKGKDEWTDEWTEEPCRTCIGDNLKCCYESNK